MYLQSCSDETNSNNTVSTLTASIPSNDSKWDEQRKRIYKNEFRINDEQASRLLKSCAPGASGMSDAQHVKLDHAQALALSKIIRRDAASVKRPPKVFVVCLRSRRE